MLISSITIGDRIREDLGEVAELEASISRHGLLEPVVVTRDGVLVDGLRRIRASENLGRVDVPVYVIDTHDRLNAEWDANTVRKDWTYSERTKYAERIEKQLAPRVAAERIEKISAAARATQARRRGERVDEVKVTTPPRQVRDIAAAAVGMSGPTYRLAKAVVCAAQAEPERFGDLPALMDETGNVSGAHRELEHRRAGTSGRHAIHYKRHTPKSNEVVRRAVSALEGICAGLAEVDPADVDANETKAWRKALESSSAALRRFARGLK